MCCVIERVANRFVSINVRIHYVIHSFCCIPGIAVIIFEFGARLEVEEIDTFFSIDCVRLKGGRKKGRRREEELERRKMLGGGSQGNGAFSSSLPPARRQHQQTTAATSCWNANNPFLGSVVVPSTASEEAPTAASNLFGLASAPIQRKRPGCKCDEDDEDESSTQSSACHPPPSYSSNYSIQPLDLSLPKVKVRQHWSGGSIVQVNETIISIGDCCGCPAATSSSARSPTVSSRLNVSVVTVPQHHHHQPCHQHPVDRHQQPTPFRLQIEIPLAASDKLPGFHQPPPPPPPQHRRKSSSSNNNNIPTRPAEVSVMKEEDDDLQRLSDSAHQLRLSGYYYGHLSWKESVQLLQNTKVKKKTTTAT